METAYVPQLEAVVNHEEGRVVYGYRETEGATLLTAGECKIGEEESLLKILKDAGTDTWEGYSASRGFEKLFPPVKGFTNKLTIVAIVMKSNNPEDADNITLKTQIKGEYNQAELYMIFKDFATTFKGGKEALLAASMTLLREEMGT